MKLSLSHKLFIGFTILSLLTIFSGLATFTITEKIAANQSDIALLQEFEFTITNLEDATTTQSKVSENTVESYGQFFTNLDRSKKLAEKILHSSTCLSTSETSLTATTDSCQAIMLEAIDVYPGAATEYYERTLFVTNLIEKNRFIFKRMIETANQLPQRVQKSRATSTINQLEMLKHELEETNNYNEIQEMQHLHQSLQVLDLGSDLASLVKMFIDNNEQLHLNRQKIEKDKNLLSKSTNRFRKTARATNQAVVKNSLNSQTRIRLIIIFVSLTSIALTLSFWLFTSYRLSRFLKNHQNAINSIKAGNYDYPITKVTNDELGEICIATKDLAVNLKKEIAARESSKQEKTNLQAQLMQAQRHESIGMLTGGIAHDFNNMLTGITGYTDLALARLEDDHPVKKYLEIISQSAQQAAEMTRKLLAFNRKQETGKQILNLNDLISNLSKILNRMVGEDISLKLETTPDLPRIMADPAQLEQVLMNMTVNGKDAMPNGGQLTITTSATTLDEIAVADLAGVDPGDFIHIAITDNGIGMTSELKNKIFDPFFTTKAQDRGTGLGLATVIDIIKQHNGHVTVDSEIEQGTTFNFFLPTIAAGVPLDDKTATSDPVIVRGQETVLLVDDNDTAREFICETLEYCGYKLLTADSGSEAVKIMHQTDYPIDLLLTDVIMPGMDGTELAATARKLHPTIKIIFMSGYDDLPAGHELKTNTPAANFLKKPMTIETLSRKVRDAIDQ